MRKLMKNLHLWLSLPVGLVISITCFTGAMLIFEKEISEAVQRHYYRVESVGDVTLSFDEVVAMVEPMLEQGQRITGITVSSDEERTWKVNLSKPKHAAVYVDQYSGEVLGSPERLPFFRTMFRMHRWLMDSKPADGGIFWGKVIVGISTLTLVFILLSGVVIWIPKSVKMLKNRSKVSVRHGWRRFFYDLHVAGGIYAAVLVLAMALTGLTWSFGWYRTTVYKLFGADGKQTQMQQPQRGKGGGDYAAMDIAYEDIVARYEAYNEVTVTPNSVSVKLAGMGNSRAADKYTLNTEGDIATVEMYDDAPRRQKVSGWIYATHVGNFGGYLTRILWFLAAMLGASLPLTGYYLWIKRKFGAKSK